MELHSRRRCEVDEVQEVTYWALRIEEWIRSETRHRCIGAVVWLVEYWCYSAACTTHALVQYESIYYYEVVRIEVRGYSVYVIHCNCCFVVVTITIQPRRRRIIPSLSRRDSVDWVIWVIRASWIVHYRYACLYMLCYIVILFLLHNLLMCVSL